MGGYAKIEKKVVFLVEPERFPFLFKRKIAGIPGLRMERLGEARKEMLAVGLGRENLCFG